MSDTPKDPRIEAQKVSQALDRFNEKISGLSDGLSGDADEIRTDLLDRVAACKELKELLDQANEARKQRYRDR
jgi:hypothetical protein